MLSESSGPIQVFQEDARLGLWPTAILTNMVRRNGREIHGSKVPSDLIYRFSSCLIIKENPLLCVYPKTEIHTIAGGTTDGRAWFWDAKAVSYRVWAALCKPGATQSL